MQQVGDADLLQEVRAVVAGASVHAQAHRNAHFQHLRDAGDAGGELHVRDRAVAYARPGLCQQLQFFRIEMNPVGVPDIIADPAQLLHVSQGTQADLLQRIVFLILCLAQMGMETDMVLTGQDGAFTQQVLGDREG